jgi:transposase
MEVLHRRVAGLDVHQGSIAACLRILAEGDGKPWAHARTFETLPAQLAALAAWLRQHAVTHVAMEATGVYWMPVYAALEAAGFDVTLCNAHHVKNVPGRKTDQSDAAWLAQLMAAGLLRKSFVPPAAVRTLRELTRARVHRTEDRARVVNGLHRLLERAGVKLCSVVSDLQGVTARAILQALADGQTDATALAAQARGKLRSKRGELEAVLAVRLGEEERMLLAQSLAMLALCDEQVAALDARIEARLKPYRAQVEALRSVGGIDAVAAAAILAEVGTEMGAWATGAQMAAWAGLAPGQRESAGKKKRAGTREGNAYLRRILVQVAAVLSRRKKPHDLTDFFRKKLSRGYKKALVATAHKLLLRIRRLLESGESYRIQPPPTLTEAQKRWRKDRAVAQLQELGFVVDLQPAAA